WWEPASSAWRWRPLCAHATWTYTWWRPNRGRSSACWAPSWAISCAHCTSSTASTSTWVTRCARSASAQSPGTTAPRCPRSCGWLEGERGVVGSGGGPVTGLAEQAGCKVDRGILVDQHLETTVPGIFAAGDVARWPDPRTGRSVRIEHWVVAERLGQVAARNL